MNPVVYALLIVGLATLALARPLVSGRVPMNRWHGIRVRAAFASPEAWYAINHYAGRLLSAWAALIVLVAFAGAFIPHVGWVAYDWASLGIIVLTFVWIMTRTAAYCRDYHPPGK